MSGVWHILILAAGEGTRMHSKHPKVLQPILFRPMIHYVMDLAKALQGASQTVVVGYGRDRLLEELKDYRELKHVVQNEQLGTAHAVRMAESLLSGQSGHLLVLSGDVILLKEKTLRDLMERHLDERAQCTFLTTEVPNPSGYGRVIRADTRHSIVGICEERDCSPDERKIKEINTGIYCFEISHLFSCLGKIQNKNHQQEYYLTDALEILISQELKVVAKKIDDFEQTLGINDRAALVGAEQILQQRINGLLLAQGVTLHDPMSTVVDPRCRIQPDVEIEGGCVLVNTVIGKGSTIERMSRVVNSTLDEGVTIRQGSYIEGSHIGRGCVIGPYARLRPETKLARNVKIGNFVEIKKSQVGEDSKASHLSYIGDAEIGSGVNLGCGFITCNYDGRIKHRTIIEDGVFVGSDSQMVAPVTLGAGSYVASGSTITKDVPPGSLAFGRSRQINKAGYGKRYQKDPKEG